MSQEKEEKKNGADVIEFWKRLNANIPEAKKKSEDDGKRFHYNMKMADKELFMNLGRKCSRIRKHRNALGFNLDE